MSDYIGPSNRLPGQFYPFTPDGRDCDQCDLEATHAIVGETDSMGSEILHLCNIHTVLLKKELEDNKERESICDICHKPATTCMPFRDPAEGSTGRVYSGCLPCRTEIIASFTGDEDDIDPDPPDINFDQTGPDAMYPSIDQEPWPDGVPDDDVPGLDDDAFPD